MPTDAPSLLLYVGLLLPGFAFSVARRRHRPAETLTAFRETTSAVFVSVICDAFLLVLVTTILSANASAMDTITAISRNPTKAVRADPVLSLFALTAFLAISSIFGYILGTKRIANFGKWVTRAPRGESGGSSWHGVFQLKPGALIFIGAQLKNGTYVQGYLYGYDNKAEDVADRGLVLNGEVKVRSPESEDLEEIGSAFLIVEDREVLYLTATYVKPTSAEPVVLNKRQKIRELVGRPFRDR